MKQESTTTSQSPVGWESLDEFARIQIEEIVQEMLEAEVSEHLGRERYERKSADSKGYRNGYGKPRKVSLSCGTVEIRRPRVRDLDERFESRVIPLFVRQSQKVRAVLPELYLEGLALRDFDRALRGLLGDGAPLSPSTIARLKSHWNEEYAGWRHEPIDEEFVYLWADGVYVKAGLEKDKAAVLVVIGVTTSGEKRVLAVDSGYRESAESWKSVFRNLMKRGMNVPKAVVADGGLGLWAAIGELGWQCKEQRCWQHKIRNVKDALPRREQEQAQKLLSRIPKAETVEEATKLRNEFLDKYEAYTKACERMLDDWERMIAFYELPKDHWRGLRTTNVVESPFNVVRLRTGPARRFKRVESATAIIWKLLMIAESSFKRYTAAYLLEDVARGQQYVNGEPQPAARSNVA